MSCQWQETDSSCGSCATVARSHRVDPYTPPSDQLAIRVPEVQSLPVSSPPEPATSGSEPSASPRVWVVRADGHRKVELFVGGGYVEIGWFDLSTVTDSAGIWQQVRAHYPNEGSGLVGQLRAFRFEMAEDDYVISPSRDRGSLRYGHVVGKCERYVGDEGLVSNRRAIEWRESVLRRSDLSRPFRSTLNSDRIVYSVKHVAEFFDQLEAAESDDDGLEKEQDDSAATEAPFDPAKIRIRTVTLVVAQLVSRVDHNEIDLNPDFQRRPGIWGPKRKSRLIESLLLRIPIPVFYVAESADDYWAIVDGLQRIHTIHRFVTNKYRLTTLEYRTEFDGYYHRDLPRAMQRRISETQLHINIIELGTPEEVMFNIFHRINTGGKPLNGQEIRHALHRGPTCRKLLKTLAATDEFLTATDYSVKPDRMADQECILRFLAFFVDPWEKYDGESLDRRLGQTMKDINTMSTEEHEIVKDRFRRSMVAARDIFGEHAFRKTGLTGGPRSPVSRPLFEAWSVALARCSASEVATLVQNRSEVRERFARLVREDTEFEKAISTATGTPRNIRKRFQTIHDLVKEFI